MAENLLDAKLQPPTAARVFKDGFRSFSAFELCVPEKEVMILLFPITVQFNLSVVILFAVLYYCNVLRI